MDWEDRLRKLATREITGEIKVFEYGLAADEIKRLRDLLREAGDELEWFLSACNSRGAEGPPRVWRLVQKIRNALPPNV